MKLILKNVGRIYDKTEIVMDGITVLAGENGTGKSTIGKALYCTFDAFHDYEAKILKERVDSIYRSIKFLSSNREIQRGNYQTVKNRIRDLIEEYSTNGNDDVIIQFLNDYGTIDQEDINSEIFKRIRNAIKAHEEDVLKSILLRHLNVEFDSQIEHISHQDELSKVELLVKNEKIAYSVFGNEAVDIAQKQRLIKDIIYIDDPYVLDELPEAVFRGSIGHRDNLVLKLRNIKRSDFSAVDDVIANNKLKKIYEKLNQVGIGSLHTNAERGYVYSDSKLKKDISIVNLSTGIKSFAIIKTLLQEGYLEDNGVVILDEPETHLHPEWMVIYAEIVVLLQDILGINFLISTHSSDFLSFIEYFTKKYKVEERTKYYMLINDEEKYTTKVEDVEDDLELIYSKLSKPFLKVSEELDTIDEA